MAIVEFDKLSKSFGETTALEQLTCLIPSGELLVVVGPSGCGKSTLLRLVSGLETPDGGRILIDGEDVSRKSPKDRGCAMVFQSYALYPHWTVRQNIGFPLRVRRTNKKQIAETVLEIAMSLGLTDKLDRRPKDLSGGERQRVALGRAMAAKPKVYLFDEPLSNLDAPLRAELRAEIVSRQRQSGTTTLYVTHDQAEALTMGDQILVLDSGCMMGFGAPEELYHNPPNRFVATFLGRPAINLIRGCITTTHDNNLFEPLRWQVADHLLTQLPSSARNNIELGIRPEFVRVIAPREGAPWRVASREFLGDRMEYRATNGAQTLSAIGAVAPVFAVDERIDLHVATEHIMFFDPHSGVRIS